jgi:hypothetical protein
MLLNERYVAKVYMKIVVSELSLNDRESWEKLYYQYAGFYQVAMNQEILDMVWSWIFDEKNQFFTLIARNESGEYVGLMHYRAMASPLRGSLVGFLDDLYVAPKGERVL